MDNLLIKLSNIPRNNIVIGIFDRDKHVREPDEGKCYTALKNNVFRFNVPALENDERQLADKICIEHYYSDTEIETVTDFGHLYMAKDFNEYGVSSDGHWIFQNFSRNSSLTHISIIDSANRHLQKHDGEAKIISKDDFADYVINHPDEFNFENFRKIFDVISAISIDVNAARAE